MNRMVISLEDSDKFWLAKESKTQKKSIAQIIRDALHNYRKYFNSKQSEDFEDLLNKTCGIWKHPEDALDYQLKIRSEWDHRP